MSNENTDRRCKSCNKLLLDEKLPICPRCMLEGRNKVGKIGGIIAGLGTAALSSWSLIKDNDSNVNADSDDEEC